MLKLSCSKFFSIVLLIISIAPVSALQIEPLIGMIEVEAGQEGTGSITLKNDKDAPLTVELLLKDFALSGSPIDHEWITLETDSLVIEAGGQALLNYRTFIPEQAEGEYSVRIRCCELPGDSEKRLPLSIKTAISVPFYALIKGTERYDCKIIDFQISGESANEAAIVFSNNGNSHVRPEGYCRIKKRNSAAILESIQINKGGSPIYPGQERTFKIQFDEVLPVGSYVAELQFALFAGREEYSKGSFEFEVDQRK